MKNDHFLDVGKAFHKIGDMESFLNSCETEEDIEKVAIFGIFALDRLKNVFEKWFKV